MPRDEQLGFIASYRALITIIKSLADRPWIQSVLRDIEKKLATGLLNQDFDALAYPHNVLQSRVEKIMREVIESLITDDKLSEIKTSLGIQSGKAKHALSYTERLKILLHYSKKESPDPDMANDLEALFTSTVTVRNAFAHSDWERLSIKSYIEALFAYCKFLIHWDEGRD
jgi:hypothetical protein